MKISFENATSEEIRKSVRTHYKSKKRYNPSTKPNELASKVALGNGKKLLYKALDNNMETYTLISRARCGAIPLYNDYKRWQLIKQEFQGKCLSCGQKEQESIEHLLINCDKFSEIRNETIRDVKAIIENKAPNKWRTLLLSYLLMGRKSDSLEKSELKNFSKNREQFWRKWHIQRQLSLKKSTK